ncbi:MAG: hypothetical protein AB7J28_14955 [Hyphomonadaceae bacterium]
MTRYLAVYTGTPEARAKSGWDKLDDKARSEREQAGMHARMQWGEKHASSIVVQGGPLGGTKRVGKEGVSDIKNNLAGYIVIEAPSHEAAAQMFEGHPHFSIFPGDSVEVMPCLPIPGQ